ncbi:hypothetical protein FE374_11050 [Georgenia yuyongxinii]|uniref:DUF4386 family protein n=1 Tax=Georgenia yuyongxinii TaxID=2589797 RepID=A0A5B8C7D9_9MICO|nr:hypothetical protein [Georgenia yuyongxinii]QDC25072.1 hypothetical protein FE374_11050 [Georgenia yuyongxinii]
MHISSPTVRWTVVVALVLAALTTVVSVLLMPDFSGTHADWLTAIAAGPAAATASSHLFTVSQLFVAVGVVGVAAQIYRRAPRLTFLAALLVVLEAFGHAVHGGLSATMVEMAADPANADTYAALLEGVESPTGLLPYMALGLLGAVVGLILLGVALLRAGYGPRWLGVTLIAFVVVEFGLSGISMWATYLSGALFLVAFLAMAALTARGSDGGARRPATASTAAEVGSK